MVRAVEQEHESYRSRLFHFKGMMDHDNGGGGRHGKSLSEDQTTAGDGETLQIDHDVMTSRSQGSTPLNEHNVEKQQIGWSLHKTNDRGPKSRFAKEEAKEPSDMDLMKEKFAKLLLGEDMSGGGKGVSSALALSNAITNLAASAFGEQKRLEPMALETRTRWKKEIDWLLSVTDHIVEMIPVQQKTNGMNMEIMTTRQRTDLLMNIPALRKLDAMLIDCLDRFKDQNEFYYVSKDADESEKGSNKRQDEKWWLPIPKVPPGGLSETTRKWLLSQKECVNQVLKAAMAINAQVLSEMEIPENYIETLPKNGRASLGDSIYKSITVDCFDPQQFLSTLDLSTEHKTLDLKNRIEASIVIWKRKMNQKDNKPSWGSTVSLEKRELFEERAEAILLLLKQRFPGLPQSALEISKIQYNRDVGHAILESYSRILESLAYTVLSRIDDVLRDDDIGKDPSQASRRTNLKGSTVIVSEKIFNPRVKVEKFQSAETPTSMTLSDFMGWNLDQGDTETNKEPPDDDTLKETDGKLTNKLPMVTTKKVSYIEKLENLGSLRSPTARH